MQNPRASLSETYGQMSAEELLERWCDGHLTDIAIEVAREEFCRRGLQPPEYVAEEPPLEAPVRGQRLEFVEVARSLNLGELEILRARLEGDGIPSRVADDNTNRMNSLWSLAIGGTRLLVPEHFATAAREIIALVNSGAFALRDNDDLR